MFSNLAWTEMLVIALVAILVVGPKDLPGMLRQLGKTIGSVKRMAGDFQRQFNDAVKDAELDDLKDMTSAKGFSPLEDAKKSMEEFTKTVEESVSSNPQSTVENASETAEKIEAPAVPAKPAAKRKPAKSGSGSKQAAKKTAVRTKASARNATGKTTTTRKTPTRKSAARAKTNS